MSQYLLSVWSTQGGANNPSEEETQAAYAAVDVFNQKLQDSGAWVFAGGLHDASTATVVDGRGTDVVTTDGPFSEAKEMLGGFWVVEAPDLDVAIALAAEGSTACRGKVEVRPFQGE